MNDTLGFVIHKVLGPGLVALVIAVVLAARILVTQRHNVVAQRLVILLVVEGLFAVGLEALDWSRYIPDASDFVNSALAVVFVMLPITYYWFIEGFRKSKEFPPDDETPWRHIKILGASILGAAVLAVLIFDLPYDDLSIATGIILQLLLSLVGLAVAVRVYSKTPKGTVAKERAKWYAVAFGVRDILWFVFVIHLYVAMTFDINSEVLAALSVPNVNLLYFEAILGYAVLRYQILDIDLKLATLLQSSAVVGLLGATYFVVLEGGRYFVEEHFNFYAGVAFVALMAMLLKPFSRFSQKLTGRILPHLKSEETYLAYRKCQTYRLASEDAYRTKNPGAIASLSGLRARLELSEPDAALLESEARRIFESEASSSEQVVGGKASGLPLAGADGE